MTILKGFQKLFRILVVAIIFSATVYCHSILCKNVEMMGVGLFGILFLVFHFPFFSSELNAIQFFKLNGKFDTRKYWFMKRNSRIELE